MPNDENFVFWFKNVHLHGVNAYPSGPYVTYRTWKMICMKQRENDQRLHHKFFPNCHICKKSKQIIRQCNSTTKYHACTEKKYMQLISTPLQLYSPLLYHVPNSNTAMGSINLSNNMAQYQIQYYIMFQIPMKLYYILKS